MRLLILLLALACVAVARDTNEATCPPARFISCGPEPHPNLCLSAVVNPVTDERECCWLTNTSGGYQQAAWTTTYFSNVAGVSLVGMPTQFGIAEDRPIMNATFNDLTRVATELECFYYVTENCGSLGDAPPVHVLTLRATDPSRFKVSVAVSQFTIRETTANPDEFVCDCDRKDALPLPERYRCCYWDSGVPTSQPNPPVMRTTSCRAPRAVPRGEPDCTRTLRGVTACGDSGACYCRYEYNAAAGVTRDPWGCGQCCLALTDNFGRDLTAKRNNTRTSCLDSIFPFTPSDGDECQSSLLPLREQIFSAATALRAFVALVVIALAAL